MAERHGGPARREAAAPLAPGLPDAVPDRNLPEPLPGHTGPSGVPGRSGQPVSPGEAVPPRAAGRGPRPFFTGGRLSDALLISRYRSGDDSAYAELYRRHADSVFRYARGCCVDTESARKLTDEVFARLLRTVRAGGGPRLAVRPCLLGTVQEVAAEWAAAAEHPRLVEDFALFALATADRAGQSGEAGPKRSYHTDVRAMEEADRTVAVRAFRTLPERWQAVLWHSVVEREPPARVAPLLGLTAQGTAALAHRAREGVRQAYLQAYSAESRGERQECGRYTDRLGARSRRAPRPRIDRRLRGHLRRCARCRTAHAELTDLDACLRTLLPVALIGWAAAAYAGKTTVAGLTLSPAPDRQETGSGRRTGHRRRGAARRWLVTAKLAVGAGMALAAVAALVLTGREADGGKQQRRPQADPPVSAPAAGPGDTEPAPGPPGAKAGPAPGPGGQLPPYASGTAKRKERKQAGGPAGSTAPGTAPPETGSAGSPGARPPSSGSASRSPASLGPTFRDPGPDGDRAAAVFPLSGLAWGRSGGADAKPAITSGGGGPVLRRSAMSVGGTTHPGGGLTVLAPSDVVIELNRPCKAFDAMVGIDDLSPGWGAVVFTVHGDGRRLSGPHALYGGRQAAPVHVDLTGIRRLRLVAEPASGAVPVRLADWAHARISC